MRLIQHLWHALLPYYVRKRLFYLVNMHGRSIERQCRQRAAEVGKKDKIKVLFVAANLQMWRGQGVYDLLSKDPRFDVRIIISGFGYYSLERAIHFTTPLKEYLEAKGIEAPVVLDKTFDVAAWLNDFNPDIQFICQHYPEIHGNALDIEHNFHRLLAYIPYGTPTMNDQLVYNSDFHSRAWRFYLANSLNLKSAKKLMRNNAVNVRICGEPDYDKYSDSMINPWKQINDGKQRKKIIWAPHFSIASTGSFLHRSSFHWLYEGMLALAKKYENQIQIAFKPHPNLYHTLVSLPDWGQEKADAFYQAWANGFNTQLEDAAFVDLFKTSDAMIHDCGSFTGEYMMTQNPVMFTSREEKSLRKDADDFGLACLDLHYFGHSIEDVERFVLDTVIGGVDPKKESRAEFFNNVIVPPNGRRAAENIYLDLLDGLGLKPL